MTIVVYEAKVRHRRDQPHHRLEFGARYVLVDVDDVVKKQKVPGWPGARICRRDLGDGSDAPLRTLVAAQVKQKMGRELAGAIQLLTQPRVLGRVFNPLSVYWCLDENGALDAVVLEVTNTPWRERHWYVVDARGTQVDSRFAKAFHVSPLMPMDLNYRLRTRIPDEYLSLQLDLVGPDANGDEAVVFGASVTGRRLSGRSRLGDALRSSTQTLRVLTAIYAHTALTYRKGAVFHHHPSRVSDAVDSPRRAA